MQPELFDYLCSFLTPQRLDGFERVLEQRTRFLTVVLEDLYQPHNASACLRSCDCFGVQDVHVIETENEFAPNVDVALGASKWTTVRRHRHPETALTDCIKHLREHGYRLVATSPRPDAGSVRDLPLNQKTALFFGTEKDGLSPDVFRAADDVVRIPMLGFTESFNISVAVAIALYELTTRLRQQLRTDWGLSEAEKHALRIDWVKKSLGSKLEPCTRRFFEDAASQQ